MSLTIEKPATGRQTFTVRKPTPKVALPVILDEPHRVWERDGFSMVMGKIPADENDRPTPEIERGTCPDCGGQLVANLYWHARRGYLLRYECWEGLLPNGVCRFYAVP